MGLLLETTSSCVSPFIQRAGIEALHGDQSSIRKTVNTLLERRDYLVGGLNSLPNVSCTTPEGAFYVFPNIKKTGMTSQEFAELMLNKANVSLVPGNVFGEYGEGYVRLSYTTSIENIKTAIENMRKVL
jgi:aspartate/methionine/tyrosine aminotransferase